MFLVYFVQLNTVCFERALKITLFHYFEQVLYVNFNFGCPLAWLGSSRYMLYFSSWLTAFLALPGVKILFLQSVLSRKAFLLIWEAAKGLCLKILLAHDQIYSFLFWGEKVAIYTFERQRCTSFLSVFPCADILQMSIQPVLAHCSTQYTCLHNGLFWQ